MDVIFNPSFPYRLVHMVLAAYLTTAFLVGAVGASSRTRANTDQFKQYQRARKTLASLLSKLPPDLLASEEARMLSSIADQKVYSLVHLIYRSRHVDGRE